MKYFIIAILSVFAIACGSTTGDDACENIKTVCKDDAVFQKFNMGSCVAYFNEDVDGREDAKDCVAEANDCSEVKQTDCSGDYFAE